MKICPTCSSRYDDDANFCPMDATRLPEPISEPVPASATLVDTRPDRTPPDKTLIDRPAPVAGRFTPLGPGRSVPTGTLGPAEDAESGDRVLLLVVDGACVPTTAAGDRALRELKQLAKVKSDKVLRVVDQGRAADGRLYVASEAPEGRTLEELMAEGPLPLGQAKAVVLAAGEALSEALKMGVIHRDLAPRHIYLGGGLGESVKLTGFGVAETVGDRVYGSPAFLSPEQAEGKPVDQRSNIYSLGALFYLMVTGAPPFEGDDAAQVQQQLHAQPAPPSTRNAALPAEADKVILKALEKSPGRRHLTLRQLLVEVAKIPAPAAAATPARVARDESDAALAKKTVLGMAMPRVEAPSRASSEPSSPASGVSVSGVSSGTSSASSASSPSAPSPSSAMPTVVIEPEPTAPTSSPSAAGKGKGREVPLSDRPTVMSMPAAQLVELAATVPASAAASIGASARVSAMDGARANGVVAPQGGATPPGGPVAAAASSDGDPAAGQDEGAGRQRRKSGKRRAFRETGWFKQGELQEEFAKHAVANDDPLAGPIEAPPTIDDSALTSEDRARFSLRTGHTEMMQAIKPDLIPGDRMSEAEMLDEISGTRKSLVYAGAALGLLAILAAIYFLIK